MTFVHTGNEPNGYNRPIARGEPRAGRGGLLEKAQEGLLLKVIWAPQQQLLALQLADPELPPQCAQTCTGNRKTVEFDYYMTFH